MMPIVWLTDNLNIREKQMQISFHPNGLNGAVHSEGAISLSTNSMRFAADHIVLVEGNT